MNRMKRIPRRVAMATAVLVVMLGPGAQAARPTFVYVEDRGIPALEGRVLSGGASALAAAASQPRGGDLYVLRGIVGGVAPAPHLVAETMGRPQEPTLFREVEACFAPSAVHYLITSAEQIQLAVRRGELLLRPTGNLVELSIGSASSSPRTATRSARDGSGADATSRLERDAVGTRARGTTLEYRVSFPGTISLRLYDVRGRLVRHTQATAAAAGTWIALDVADEGTRGRRLAGGVYFYRIDAPGAAPFTGRFVLIR